MDAVFDHDRVSTLATPAAVNSTMRDLQNLSNVDRDAWFGVTLEGNLIEGTTAGFEEQVTGGFGRDPRTADDVGSGMIGEMAGQFDQTFGDGTPQFAFVFVGLGGGTGCGIAPHVADAITEFAGRDTKIITVAVLPNTKGDVAHGDDESVSAVRQASNTVFGLDRIERVSDGVILVDNQRLAYEDAAEGRFSEFNDYIAAGIVDLISGPVLEQIDPGTYDSFDAPVIDLQDVVTALTLADGTGYATIGRSVVRTRSLAGYLVPFVGKRSVDGDTLAQLAISKRSVADLPPSLAQKAIGQVRAPGEYVTPTDRRIEVSVIRSRLDSYCPEINLGMMLTERNLASFTTLLTYDREDIERISEIESLAAGREVAETA